MNTLREMARLRRFLTIDQIWRRRSDRALFSVVQVYRADSRVLVRDAAGELHLVQMSDLLPGRGWVWIYQPPRRATPDAEEASAA